MANTMDYYSALKSKEILAHATSWTNFKDIKVAILTNYSYPIICSYVHAKLGNKLENKPATKGQILHDTTYVRRLLRSDAWSGRVVAEGVGSGCLMGTEFQFCKMKKVLKTDGGDGCTTIRMYLMPPNCTFKIELDGNFYVICI